MKTYVGCGAQSLSPLVYAYPVTCHLKKQTFTRDDLALLSGATSCLCAACHSLLVRQVWDRFSIPLDTTSNCTRNLVLEQGDRLVLLSIDLPRLEGREEYTQEEASKAEIRLGAWTVEAIASATPTEAQPAESETTNSSYNREDVADAVRRLMLSVPFAERAIENLIAGAEDANEKNREKLLKAEEEFTTAISLLAELFDL